MALSAVVKGVVLALVLALLVLLWMNFLRVSNLEDEVNALRVEVDDLKSAAAPPPAPTDTPLDVQTAQAFAGDPAGASAQWVALAGGGSIQKAVIALTELIEVDGTTAPVVTSPVVVLPQLQVEMPLPPEAGCVPTPGRRPAWILALDGPRLRVTSRDCVYTRPVRGRLRGVVTR